MPPRRLIAGFLWRFALAYGLLIAPWPGFNAAYGRYFRSLGQRVFAHESGPRELRFEAVPAELRHRLDTRIVVANRAQFDRNGAGPAKFLELDTRGVGWVPTALTLALILATPIPWPRRSMAVLWGVVAVHGFVLFSVAVYIWNRSTDLSLVTLSPFWKQAADGLEETLITQLGPSFVVPVLIWILVTIRREDVLMWRSIAAASQSNPVNSKRADTSAKRGPGRSVSRCGGE